MGLRGARFPASVAPALGRVHHVFTKGKLSLDTSSDSHNQHEHCPNLAAQDTVRATEPAKVISYSWGILHTPNLFIPRELIFFAFLDAAPYLPPGQHTPAMIFPLEEEL